MSKVGNLRAMFEQKGESSPPDRGRSPGIPSSGTESPRPLSKVRTSFIAIEKDGRIGLQKDTSRDSSVVSTRKFSGETDITSASTLQEKTNTPLDGSSNMDLPPIKTSLKEQPIPESPRVDQRASPAKTPEPLPEKREPSPPKMAKKEPEKKSPAKKIEVPAPATPNGTASAKKLNGTAGKEKPKPAVKEESKTATPAKIHTNSNAELLAPHTAAADGKHAKPPKSPTMAKTPKVVAASTPKLASRAVEKSTAHPEKNATHPEPAAHNSAASPPKATTGSAASSIKKPPRLQASPSSALESGIGFVKPKVKSPTMPLKLPAGLTTHTAASGSKVNAQRQTLSRASGVYGSEHRSPSRASVATSSVAGKALKRQNSTINRPRPSIGPPPKQAAKDHPQTKKEKEVDEGFLARMMRPTQASAQKTTEKVPTTPPRRAGAPVAPAAKKVAVFHGKGDHKPVKKAVGAAATSSAGASSVKTPEPTAPANEVAAAAAAEQAETAEEVVTVETEAKVEVMVPEPVKEKEVETVVAAPAETPVSAAQPAVENGLLDAIAVEFEPVPALIENLTSSSKDHDSEPPTVNGDHDKDLPAVVNTVIVKDDDELAVEAAHDADAPVET